MLVNQAKMCQIFSSTSNTKMLTFTLFFLLFHRISAVDIIFNSFNSSSLRLYGVSSIQSSVLTITDDRRLAIGRALFRDPIQTRNPNSSVLLPFSTSFIFAVTPTRNNLPGHGFAFIVAPTTGIVGASTNQHLGLLGYYNNGNSTNHVFAVEFDVVENWEFNDISNNHVGVNVNSLTSVAANEAGYWSEGSDRQGFVELDLNNGENYQVWIDYVDSRVNVYMAPAGMRKPRRALISVLLDLSDVLLDQMYIGFCGSTGFLVETHRILSWAFSNSNSSIGDALVTSNLPSFVPIPKHSMFRSRWFIAGVTAGIVCLIMIGIVSYIFLVQRKNFGKEVEEEWELQFWPHRFDYVTISKATNEFSDKNIIGCGANGMVYKGLVAGVEVAVKRISVGNKNGMKEFIAEISTLGRLKHRNLVGLRGWCKGDNKSLILIYNYMENGSLDKRIFECENTKLLSWEARIKALKDVANGVLYLHDGWESRVLYRDIKASNVLLDKDMVARLGDFGLARLNQPNDPDGTGTTTVVGTIGYMAPELIRIGRVSGQTDVYGFGILILEVVCGRRPIEEGKPGLVDWVFQLMEGGDHICAVDYRLQVKGGIVEEEVKMVLNLALMCVQPDPNKRPEMRQILMSLEGSKSDFEQLVLSIYERTVDGFGHPTYDDIRNSTFSIPSWSDVISEGR